MEDMERALRAENDALRQQVAAARLIISDFARRSGEEQALLADFLAAWPALPTRQGADEATRASSPAAN